MLDTLETLIADGYILAFNSETLDVVKTARALTEAGIHNMEITCRIRNAAGKLRILKDALPDFKAGGASLIDFDAARGRANTRGGAPAVPSVDEMAEAGADFLVSAAGFKPETYGKYGGKLPIIAGCGTVTEILQQFDLGANLCKFFPAGQLGGAKFVEAVDPAIHKMVSLMPTGGTTVDNIPDYIAAGVLIAGGSFSMIPKDSFKTIQDKQDYGLLAAEFRKIKELIDSCRAKKYPSLDFNTASLAEIAKATGRHFGA